MTTAGDIRGAADILERTGWCKGVAHDPSDGSFCIEGALWEHIVHQQEMPIVRHQIFRAAMDALTPFLGENYVSKWNDKQADDAKELVIKTLRACADALDDVQR